jgi:hypothetical protein
MDLLRTKLPGMTVVGHVIITRPVVLAVHWIASPTVPIQILGEIPNIRIMYNDIEHSISIDFYIYISIFQVF